MKKIFAFIAAAVATSAWRKILADYTPGAGAADADLPLDTGNSGFMQV